jgi:ATP-dependent exoDNAse (exonuclease V) beta subunit
MNFTVYRSSAGSGKTFTLVKEYLKIALADEHQNPFRFRKILAITFTNKAAQEMKDRVIRALKELSAPKPGELSPLAKILSEELKLDAATLAVRAENLLRAILHHYSDFAIGTIDAFTHRIVRSFAYDLGLPVNFEIETEKDELLQKAVDKLMSMIGTDKDITTTLIRFSEEKTDAEKGWQIESELKSTAEFLLQESGSLYAERLRELTLDDFTEIRSKIYTLTKQFEDQLTLLAQKALSLMTSSGLEESDFSQGNKGIAAWYAKISKADYKTLIRPNSYVLKTIEEDTWFSGAAKKSGKDKFILGIAPSLKEIYTQIRAYAEQHYPLYVTRNAMRRHLYSLAVLNELEKILHSFREEENMVHISEFNHIISKVVAEQPVPYIFEKLGARYSHFLVDEFQDTSVLQWENLLPLLENGLAENNFSMVVGDAKQAIYRWRSGDVEQFVTLPKLINKSENPLMQDREQSLVRHYREEELSKNFRSRRIVVEFNNSLFLSLAALLTDQYNRIYQRVAQEIKPGNEGGYVELRFPVRDGSREETYATYTAECITLVKQLLDEGWRKNEIALLVRENRHGSLLANALITEGIPVLSSDSLLIKNSPLVTCVVSLLRVLEHPEDRIALTDVAEYLNKTGRTHFPLHNIKSHNARLKDILQEAGIHDDLSYLSVLPLYQQCESLVRTVFPQEQKNAWIIFFLDELLRFSASRNPDRQSFFAWWEDRSRNASVVIPEGTDAVNIMTIHKSKGLEFPVVIIPYLDWKRKAGAKELWVEIEDAAVSNLEVAIVTESDELKESSVRDQYNRETDKKVLDQMNVLYVACTRAVDQLYILSEKGKDDASDPINVISWLNKTFKEQLAESDVVTFGEKETPERKAEEKSAVEFIPLSAGEGKWAGKIRVRKYSEDAWSEAGESSAREQGILLHNLLRRISSADDIPKVLESAVNSGFIPKNESPEFHRMLQEVISHPELAPFFNTNDRAYAETDIIIPGDSITRPDRVVVRGEEAVVLEYKSGAESDAHLHQVKHYKSVLERMGYQKISGKLIYLSPLKIVSV